MAGSQNDPMTPDYPHTITRHLPPPYPWESVGPGNHPIRKGTLCRVIEAKELAGTVSVVYLDPDGVEQQAFVPASAVEEGGQAGLGL